MFWAEGRMQHGTVRELPEGRGRRSKEVQVGTAGQGPEGHTGRLDFIPEMQATGCKIRCALQKDPPAEPPGRREEQGTGEPGNASSPDFGLSAPHFSPSVPSTLPYSPASVPALDTPGSQARA